MIGMNSPAGMVGDDQEGILPGAGAFQTFLVRPAVRYPVRHGRSLLIVREVLLQTDRFKFQLTGGGF
jgi:hypothetical protein